MIYFIRRPDNGWIKIGTTTQLSQRLRVLSHELDLNLEMLGVIDGSYADEAELHRRFADLRVEGEWFLPVGDLTDFVAAECRGWDGTDEIPAGQSVKIDAKVVKYCRIAASFKRMTLAEYLNETMREIAGRDIDEGYSCLQVGSDMAERGFSKPPPPRL